MRRSLAVIFTLLMAVGAALLSCRNPAQGDLAITHATVIDMTGAPSRADQTVIIEKQRIVVVGPAPATPIPRGAKVVDATGKFLIPGLVDMHVHLTAAGEPDGSRQFMVPLLLSNGITTVRDMGSYLESLGPLRKEIAEGKRLGPRIYTPGPYLDGFPPSFQPSLIVTNRADADEDVHELVHRGVDFIKVQSMLSREAYFAIADAAKREHISFVGHVPDHVTAKEAADAGQRSIEHLTNVLRACSRDEAKLMREQFQVPPKPQTAEQSHRRLVRWQQEILDSYSQEAADALIADFVSHQVWQTPTLMLLKNDAFPTLEDAAAKNELLRYIPGKTLALWQRTRAEQMRNVTADESALRAKLFAKSEELVAQMQKAGVRILAGTDSPAPYVAPGFSLHEELELLVNAGLTPMEALQAATRNPAEFFGTEKESGVVAAGKYADLVLLDADPLQDIRNTRKIRAVILRGRLLDRAALDQLTADELVFASGLPADPIFRRLQGSDGSVPARSLQTARRKRSAGPAQQGPR